MVEPFVHSRKYLVKFWRRNVFVWQSSVLTTKSSKSDNKLQCCHCKGFTTQCSGYFFLSFFLKITKHSYELEVASGDCHANSYILSKCLCWDVTVVHFEVEALHGAYLERENIWTNISGNKSQCWSIFFVVGWLFASNIWYIWYEISAHIPWPAMLSRAQLQPILVLCVKDGPTERMSVFC